MAYGSLRSGMGALVDALAASLGERISTGSPVQALSRDDLRWRVAVGGAEPRDVTADCVVLAAPAPVASTLVDGLDDDITSFFSAVKTVPVAVVGLGYGPDHALDLPGFGHLVPSSEPGQVLGVLWSSSIFDGRAEAGTALRVILGGWRDSTIHTASDERLLELANAAVTSTLGAPATPDVHSIARHPQGLPQYGVGHLERLAAMERATRRLPGLFVTGNATRGVGVNACTKAAAEIAADVGAYCESLG